MTLTAGLIIFILIALNALYVAAEFAAVSVRRNQIHHLADEGNTLAGSLLPILNDTHKLDQYIAACQIGITLTSLILGAYGQVTLARALTPLFEDWGGMQTVAAQSIAAIIVLIGLTILQVVFGELVPKSIALQYPIQLALYTFIPMRWSLFLFTWFVYVLNGSGMLILKMLRLPAGGHRHIHSPEEIDMLLAESRDGGLLEPDEHQRLHQALLLSIRTAEQLMIPRSQLVSLSMDTPSENILQMITRESFTHLPVYQDAPENVIGILHTKDFVLRYVEEDKLPALEQIMRPVIFVPQRITADRILTRMREQYVHQVMVIDEYGSVIGMVTLDDVLTELLGEIGGEFRRDRIKPVRLADGRVRLPGLMRLYEAEHWLGVKWKGNANTVGGRVIQALGSLPTGSERIVIEGVPVEVERVKNNVIVSILAKPITDSEKDGTVESK
ncbi:MAG: hemolysin family protein [bacterium]|jgi:putative hemolysin